MASGGAARRSGAGRHRNGIRNIRLGRREISLHLLVIIAVVFGGGGVGYGVFNLIVQIAALAVLACFPGAIAEFFKEGPRVLAWLVAVSIALPILQLLPLPPGMWRGLPGREIVAESLDLIGAGQGWFPVSVDRNRTLVALSGLVAPLTVLMLGWRLEKAALLRLLQLLVLLGLVNVFAGGAQLLSGNEWANWYPGGKPDEIYGTFANHNSTGMFLIVALLALVFQPAPEANRVPWLAGMTLAGFVLVIGTVLTQSRSSSFLLVFVAILFIARVAVWLGRMRGGRSSSLVAAGVIAGLGIAAAVALFSNDKVQQTLSRFADLEDARPAIWQDTLVVAERYWPVGSGIGTFDEVFQVDESLEFVEPGRAGRAHNDYLEVAVESGLPGLGLLACWLVWLGICAIGVLKRGPALPAIAALSSLALIAAQSLLDYPLRSQALLCVAALMVAIIVHCLKAGDQSVIAESPDRQD